MGYRLFVCGAEHKGYGAVVASILRTETPQYRAAVTVKVDWLVPFCIVAATS